MTHLSSYVSATCTFRARGANRRAFPYGVLALLMLALAAAAPAPAAEPHPFDARVIHSGHSLTDPIVSVLDTMVAFAGKKKARGRAMTRSTIPGSPMDWRWNNRTEPDARTDIAAYDVLVLTERAPLLHTLPWHDSKNMALRWFTHAWTEGNAGAGAATILYATWVATDSGPTDDPDQHPEERLTFRARLPLEMDRWQEIADYVNANRPQDAPAMRLIPGPLIMGAVYDAIEAGTAPGLDQIEDLFTDNIHLNAQGAYLIALAHLAVIYDFDPRALPLQLAGLEVPPPETAIWMQELVHELLQR